MLMQFLAHPSIFPGPLPASPTKYTASYSKHPSQDNMPTCFFILCNLLDHCEQTGSDSKEKDCLEKNPNAEDDNQCCSRDRKDIH